MLGDSIYIALILKSDSKAIYQSIIHLENTGTHQTIPDVERRTQLMIDLFIDFTLRTRARPPWDRKITHYD